MPPPSTPQADPAVSSWLANDPVLPTLPPPSRPSPAAGGTASAWYLRAIYWVIVAESTIGFGDLVPATSAETAYATLVVLVGALMYPALIGAVATIVVDNFTSAAHRAAPARDFVRRTAVPADLGKQILAFHGLGQALRDETRMLRSLPPSLHAQLTAHLYAQMLLSVSVFEGCARPFLLEATSLLTTELFVPAFFIVHAGDASQAVPGRTKYKG